MKIAFDLDGTLADMTAALRSVEAQLFPDQTDPAREETPAASDPMPRVATTAAPPELTRRQQRQVWRAAARIENFWETFDEIEPGAVRTIAEQAVRRRWDVIFLTRRPPTTGRTSQEQSQRWLRRHGFSFPSVAVVPGPRGRVAASLQLDAVVDDLPENCVDVIAESSTPAILVCRRESARIRVNAARLGITVVPSVAEALRTLAGLERRRRGGQAGPRSGRRRAAGS